MRSHLVSAVVSRSAATSSIPAMDYASLSTSSTKATRPPTNSTLRPASTKSSPRPSPRTPCVRFAKRTDETDFEDFDLNPDTISLLALQDNRVTPHWLAGSRHRQPACRAPHKLRPTWQSVPQRRSCPRALDYRRRFPFVDQRQGITDPGKIASLTDLLCASLRTDPSAWAFSIPVCTTTIASRQCALRLRPAQPRTFVDPTTKRYRRLVGVDDLVEHLLMIHVETIDGGGNVTDRWSSAIA